MRRQTFSVLLLLLIILAAACGGKASTPTPAPTLLPELAEGRRVFQANCATCHSLAPGVTLVGPSLAGIAARAGRRVEGLDARGYLFNSISRPGDYLVEGFQDLMPSTLAKSLTGEQIDAVVAFLLTQN